VQLTQFSDYSLRLALYLAMHRDRVVSVQEVSAAYGISAHHLVKVVQRLAQGGVLASSRGRGGGVRLARDPQDINIGALVRLTERFDLLECFDPATNTCPIIHTCGLKHVVADAQRAFMAVLDQHTLADFLGRGPALVTVWRRRLKAEGASGRPSPSIMATDASHAERPSPARRPRRARPHSR
jgi:Rrf2 family transcriptional regulator, nitric oxide-sensitive transcriptional repressor